MATDTRGAAASTVHRTLTIVAPPAEWSAEQTYIYFYSGGRHIRAPPPAVFLYNCDENI